MLASLDGVIGAAETTGIPVTDEGLLRGDGAFEATRLYGGRPFALEDHLARLQRSCAGLRLPVDADALRADIVALLEHAGPVEGVLRIVLTRGGRRIVLVEPLPHHPSVARLATVRYAPNRVLDGLKSLSYAGNMLAKTIAKEAGYDDALLVTPHGRVLEGTTSAVLILPRRKMIDSFATAFGYFCTISAYVSANAVASIWPSRSSIVIIAIGMPADRPFLVITFFTRLIIPPIVTSVPSEIVRTSFVLAVE